MCVYVQCKCIHTYAYISTTTPTYNRNMLAAYVLVTNE